MLLSKVRDYNSFYILKINYFTDNVNSLQQIVERMDEGSGDDWKSNIRGIREVLTDLLPIGPRFDWEIEYGENRSSVEEVATWMESKYMILFTHTINGTNSTQQTVVFLRQQNTCYHNSVVRKI